VNKIRAAFVKNLLQVYYGAQVKSLKSRPLIDKEGLYGLFIHVQFKTRVRESLLLKQMDADKALMILEMENRSGDPFLPEPLFHLQLINKEHLFLQRLGGIPAWERNGDLTETQILGLMDNLETLNRRSPIPLTYGKAFDHEGAVISGVSGSVEASLALGPETLGIIGGLPVLLDSSPLAFHHSGYAIWHLILEWALSPGRAVNLLDQYYGKREIRGPRAAACRRLALEECFSDRAMTEKDKKHYREIYGGE